ncbi:MAG: hypothetical protein GWO41_07980 [candidate division Zixibacteria bacterium]|nr:hypothetical protein [candidate division Zixibacteria bacterium]NIR65479.1 hypothetical protein [candidate division Zixibacteria bacterium]NIS16931.1 hypothetical protein [candidate division Zixibacteria bacterium]NIS47168.1 hypothetical protein [candidate division Zixibacteria bacterium]NIT52664.1 hypothetical protein [candidate division Zixibacteria bacterium]
MSKKLHLLALIVIFAFISLHTNDSNADHVCGDVNEDGALNVSDAVFIINHVFIGGPAPNPNCCAGCPPTVTDYDGNVYQTVLLGDQCWMMGNLKVTHYRNGDPIQHVTDGSTWYGLSTGAFCNYNNNEGNVAVYGRLYNWYAVSDSRNLAPEGWHIPTDAEWKQLEMHLGMSQAEADNTGLRGTTEGGKLKEAGTAHWNSPNTGATNESGFTALPGGYRYSNGSFASFGEEALFWSSTEAGIYSWYRGLSFVSSQIGRNNIYRPCGFSIRCVKD